MDLSESLRLDSDGYLVDLEQWSHTVADELARMEGIRLDQRHWAVINILRDFYRRTGVSPAMRPFVKLAGEELGVEWGSSIALMKLFPGNPAKVAAKIAGLPRPSNCI